MLYVTNPLTPHEERSVVAEEWVSKTMELVLNEKAKADEAVRGMFGASVYVDEMSVLFTHPERAHLWIDAAVGAPGVEMFNTARDRVRTAPIRSEYSVQYWFLTVPEMHWSPQPWRVEAMYAYSGSPLHDSILSQLAAVSGDGGVMHASFKCADEEAYATANKVLWDNGYECVQRCESTYGRFGYWYPLGLDHDDVVTALKPRVNLRDAEAGDE